MHVVTSAEDFRKYIEDNQTDFIVFKINVLLKGVTDPIKRSEAVGSIVQSISVIKDPILRDTYIRECANRTGVSEANLDGPDEFVISIPIENNRHVNNSNIGLR